MNAIRAASFWTKAWRPAISLFLFGSLAVLGVFVWSVWRDLQSDQENLVFYSVARGDLPIVVTERGNLESQVETTIRCEVENLSYDRSSGSRGTQIIFIVPNGSAVKEGDLLVELDSSAIRERLDEQVLDYERAKSRRTQTVARYENQIIRNETAEAQARLKVELDTLQLKMYMDEEKGTFKLDLEAIERSIDDQRNKILEAQMALELAKTGQAGMQALFELGYRGKSERDKSRMALLKSEGDLTTGVNKLSDLLASRDQFNTYDFEMRKLRLEGEVATAKRSLRQVITDNQSSLAQAEAAKIEAEIAEEKEWERLERYQEQLGLCKIYAPHAGMVVYARERRRYNRGTEIAEGVMVRQRQPLIKLPDLSKMQVKTQVHEAVLDQIRPGLPTTVRVDAFPNRTYNGIVTDLAVMPTSSYYTSVKTYECTVRIITKVERLKPGMTSVVDMHVDRIRDIISVPVQAVVQVDKETWCYVDQGGVARRDIELGRSNDKFVHVIKGLQAGDRLVINPMAILEEMGQENEISPEAGLPEQLELSEEALSRAVPATGGESAASGPPAAGEPSVGG